MGASRGRTEAQHRVRRRDLFGAFWFGESEGGVAGVFAALGMATATGLALELLRRVRKLVAVAIAIAGLMYGMAKRRKRDVAERGAAPGREASRTG